jgi:manganese/zinc/iron transport system permease protein
LFLLVFLFAPSTGIFSVLYKEQRQKIEVLLLTFLLHLKNHSDVKERNVKHLGEHINWRKSQAKSVLELALKNNMITIDSEIVSLTDKGDVFTKNAINYITDNSEEAIEEMKSEFFLFRG